MDRPNILYLHSHDTGRYIEPYGHAVATPNLQRLAREKPGQPAWRTIGYDEHLSGGETHELAAAFLRQPRDQPFFLAVGFGETHRVFPPLADADDPRYCLPPAPLPDTPATRQDMARFKASARRLDQKMGAVLDALRESALAERTLVVCTTDHGIAFPRMKCNLEDSGTGVMLILRGPGGFEGGKVVDAMTSHLDIFPTICEAAGCAPPPWLRGRSLLPLVRGEVEALHEAIFLEVNYHAAYEPMRAVRTARWKYIRRYGGRATRVLTNCDDGESKTLWMERGWRTRPLVEEALYDLVFDPNETDNLAGEPRVRPVLDEMRQRLARWMEETRDPLLHGPVPAPAGALINDADGISPRETPLRVEGA